jgi:hypothetical protein
MTKEGKTLADLTTCLRGQLPIAADWLAIFNLSNRTLLTPAIYGALARAGHVDKLPEDAHGYLKLIYERNLERNMRLRAQLIEAIGALNRADIEPTLLKGAVRLFSDPDDRIGTRLTRDLDLSVQEHEAETARQCLIDLGYEDDPDTRGMGRPQDVGTLELRQRPKTPSVAYLRSEHERPANVVEHAGVRARIPSPSSRALHWIVHDMIKEGDYWRGRIDLRHLHDLGELAKEDAGIDWVYLWEIMPDPFGRNVVETQVLTMHRLFGTDIPPTFGRRGVVRVQHWRRIFTAIHPVIGMPLRIAGNLAWGLKRASETRGLRSRGGGDLVRRVHRMMIGAQAGAKL